MEIKADGEDWALKQLTQGNPKAFWSLWMRYQDDLYTYCLQWMGGNREDAEDALSRASIKAWNALPQYAARITNLRGWLIRLTHNLCMDIHRENARRIRLIQHIKEKEAVAYMYDPSEDFLLHDEIRKCILRAIDALAPRLREPVILRLLKGMSYQDIAEQLNISIENVRKRIQQARAILEEILKEDLPDIDESVWESFISEGLAPDDYDVTAASIPDREREEIKSHIATIYPVQVILPSGAEMCFYLALDHKPTRQHQKVGTLRKYVQQHPGGWKKRLELADLLYTLGSWEEAISAYRQVLEKQPRLVDVYLRPGEILRLTRREEEAIVLYESALRFARRDATLYHLRGLIELCRRNFETAARFFEEAAMLEPYNAAHWHALGFTHLRLQRPAECVRAFDEASRINPDDVVALTYSHDALCSIDQSEEAQRRVTRALEIDPDNVPALKKLADDRSASGLVKGEDGRRTRQLIHRGIRLAPDSPDIQESLARYYICQDDWEKGLAVLRTFAEEHPNSPCGWYYYAYWLFRKGDSNAAAEAIMKAYALYQEDEDIYRSEREILSSSGKLEELTPLLEKMIQQFASRESFGQQWCRRLWSS